MQSKCIKYGDDISTDLIIAGKYTKTLNKQDLADHAMEDLDEKFHERIENGCQFIVAGSYFGCGSSREQAPVALKEAGIRAVIAKDFSRIFYRNAVNIGLPIIECDTDRIADGDIISYELGSGSIKNETTGDVIKVTPLPDIMVKIMLCGGIAGYFSEYGGF